MATIRLPPTADPRVTLWLRAPDCCHHSLLARSRLVPIPAPIPTPAPIVTPSHHHWPVVDPMKAPRAVPIPAPMPIHTVVLFIVFWSSGQSSIEVNNVGRTRKQQYTNHMGPQDSEMPHSDNGGDHPVAANEFSLSKTTAPRLGCIALFVRIWS